MTRRSDRSTAAWHLLTAEYPPRIGGVGDYARQVARGLAAAGERVHVWCAADVAIGVAQVDADDAAAGVEVHRVFQRYTPAELSLVAREARRDGAVRWLVQWVPHQFGWRAMNVVLPLWLARRARAGDRVDLMIHEGGLPFAKGRWRQNAAAIVQRGMLAVAVRASDQIWMSIPGWDAVVRSVGGDVLPARDWLPIPSNIPVTLDPARLERWRTRLAPNGERVVGHFGTFGGPVGERVERLVPACLARTPHARLALLGARGDAARERIVAAHPRLGDRVVAPGALAADEVSLAVQACDVLVQPYPDGISGRRTSTMVALAHGRPVVTNVGDLSEPLWHGGSVCVAPDDVGAMAAAVAELLADDDERARVGAAGRALYEQVFALPRIVAVLRGESRSARPDTDPGLAVVSP